ncbi:hypothetical protein [Fibrobacter sp. UWR2]|uniref:hypothetical protein n=1 Tax=Fibrobacter sp. UWR2 TaxID=1964352 RepID=UPI000B5203AF|nr:hypothetical protein [Fibrobacter sp. UWR2]OWV02107.1 hypothetical protein B7994_02540 [Fibrobacter sp. UWR2]
MNRYARIACAFFAVAVAALFAGCTSHPSPQQTMVDDRYMMYKETYRAYKEAEERYLNLLFNIERMPEEEELWIMKREQMQELIQLRDLMLQARGELDDAMKDWETHLMEVQSEVKKAQIQQYNPNFKGRDGQRTSPGQLLPGEVPNTRRR